MTNKDYEFRDSIKQAIKEALNETTLKIQVIADKPSGKWEYSATFDENKRPYAMCSNCRSFYLQENIESYKYCPNCGAKMKGVYVNENNN